MDGVNQVQQETVDTLPPPDALISESVEPAPKDGKKPDLKDMTEVVLRARTRFKYINAVESDTRQAEKEDQRFVWVPGAQWNDGVRTQRMSEVPPRPVLEFDQTNPYIKRIVNDIRQSRPGIKVSPVGNGADVQTARTREGLIRQIEYQSAAEQAYDAGLEFAVLSGRGYWRIVSDWESEDSTLQVLQVRAVKSSASVFLDPDYTHPDGLDRRYGFVCEYIDKDTFEAEWPGVTAISWEGSADEGKYPAWWDGDKVCVCDYYEMVDVDDDLITLADGKQIWASSIPPNFPVHSKKTEKRTRTRVDWYKLTDAAVPLAKYDWPGKFIPIIQDTGDTFTVDGQRMYKGVVRRIRDPQMMFNYWFTAATERIALVAKAPYVSMAGQTTNHNEWKTANIQNHHMLEFDAVELPDGTFYTQAPMRQPPPEPQEAMIQMCSLAQNLMHDITGIQPPSMGEKTSPHQSGVALSELRAQSDIVTFNYGDNHNRSIRATGIILDDLIPHYYSEDRIVQIVQPDGTQTPTRINAPTVDPKTLGSTKSLDMTIGKYSITMDAGPGYQTARKEAAAQLDDFLQMLGPQQAPLYADLRAKVADWPDQIGDQIAARAFAMLPPQAQQASLEADQDPKVAPYKAAIKTLQTGAQQMQQQFQQQLQQEQQKTQQLTAENQTLKTQVQNKTLDYQARSAEYAGKMSDSARADATTQRGDTLDFMSTLSEQMVKLTALVTQYHTDMAQFKSAERMAETAANAPMPIAANGGAAPANGMPPQGAM